MRRAVVPLLGLGCFLALVLFCYRPVLFEDGQFAYRDAAGFFYPLYLRVQQEWHAGRWPLWDPGENGGAPLLGNPMAAVLYPGKVLYAMLPYAWAARLYVIAHTIIAFWGVLALARSCGVSWVGSCLGGLSYAFGAPVLFLYCNVIFLVGAAWIPWGLRAIDRLLRQGRQRGGAELALVLALQVLGGDPEAAYLTGGCGAGYALVLAVWARNRPIPIPAGWITLGAVAAWVMANLGLARTRVAWPGFAATNGLVLVAWITAALGIAWRWHRRPVEARLAPLLAGLAGSGILALALAAVQVLPVLEFAGQTARVSAESEINVYQFSMDPFRVVELVWPNLFGTNAPQSRSWLQAVPRAGDHALWIDSLYLGGLTLVLALNAFGLRTGPPWSAWLTTVAVVGLVGSFGKYGSPLWWARWGPFAEMLGPHDPVLGQPRPDHYLADGAGSLYGIIATLLPGFGVFRYPSKLLTFFAVAMAVLAAAGWDRVAAGETKWARRFGLAGLGMSLVGLVFALVARALVVAYLTGRVPPRTGFAPADIEGSWAETQQALAHGVVVFAAVLALAHWAPRRHRPAGALALLLLTADLTFANARLIWTVPQSDFDAPSEAARLIEAAERSDPSPGPFRIHRMSGWHPAHFSTTANAEPFREWLDWERGTLQPLCALPTGLEYCDFVWAMEFDDHATLFGPRAMPIPAPMARILGIPAGQLVAYFPRRSYDLWGARYFLLPASPDWASQGRGFASFLDQTELIYPSSDVLYETQSRDGEEPWALRQDWQLRRNKAAYPRAWIVHHARLRSPASARDDRAGVMRTLTFMNDPIWRESGQTVLDLRLVALIETDDKEGLREFVSPTPVGPSESVAVVKYEPQRVQLLASLDRPGLVILADTYYPGWRLSIDGKPAPIFRANRLMRGAAVPAGEHSLVYTYDPDSFRIGAIVSLAGAIVLLTLAWSSPSRRSRMRSAATSDQV